MAAKFQINRRKQANFAGIACLLPIAACMGSGTSYLQDAGLNEPLPAPLSAEVSAVVSEEPVPESVSVTPSPVTDELYADLPTGPNDTGTYPDLRVEPKVQIVSKPGEDVETLTDQMIALADAHESGRISTAAYNQRLAYLRKLANNHSTDMLAQIGEPAN